MSRKNVYDKYRLPVFMLERVVFSDIAYAENMGERLKFYRCMAGLRQVELAERLGMASSVIADYEHNRRESPGIVLLRRIVSVLVDSEQSSKKGGVL